MPSSLQILSLGLGVQSVALYYMASLGLLPRCDFAIVADTGREKTSTYQYLDYLLSWQKQHDGIPIVVRQEKNLYQDLLNADNSDNRRFSSIPAFTRNDQGSTGMLRRQCTGEYKIQVVDNAIRDLYGLKKGQRRPSTRVWKGITTDELERMDQPRSVWKVHVYPFTGFEFDKQGWRKVSWGDRMDRHAVVQWYEKNGLPLPDKSACVFCPYQSDANWQRMKQESPSDFEAAVKVDTAIRNSTRKGVTHPCYLHRSLKPLADVQFTASGDLWPSECSSNCNL